jgi:ferrochelatase
MSYYIGESHRPHNRPARTGLLLVNLGTPDAPTPRALRRYLAEFLSDPRVVEIPRMAWQPVLHGVVLRLRPRRSAAAYRRIWTDAGSPLLVHSRAIAAALEEELARRLAEPPAIALGMRYGNPSIRYALQSLRAAGATERLLVLPLYPQYAAATTGSTFDAVSAVLRRWRRVPEFRMIGQYHDAPKYIAALADSVREYWHAHGRPDKLLCSFHGLPERAVLAGDPYFCHCQKTAQLTAEALGLSPAESTVSFQSRFGRAQWLKPYTEATLREWAQGGMNRVDVVCPGFAADCLETLEEIALANAEIFRAEGGGELRYIPALNARPAHIAALADLVERHTAGWSQVENDSQRKATAERARAMGAPH